MVAARLLPLNLELLQLVFQSAVALLQDILFRFERLFSFLELLHLLRHLSEVLLELLVFLDQLRLCAVQLIDLILILLALQLLPLNLQVLRFDVRVALLYFSFQ